MSEATVLKKLNDYALELLDEDGYQKIAQNAVFKQKAKNLEGRNVDSNPSRSQKKKMKKKNKLLKLDCENRLDLNKEAPPISRKKSYREQIIEEMDLITVPETVRDEEPGNVDIISRGPEVIVFYDAAKKRKKIKEPTISSEDIQEVPFSEKKPELDFKRARYEVLRFGISGFEKNKKEDAKIALAIKLGAKPPKKEYVNYRLLMETRKQDRISEKVEREINQKMGVKLKPISKREKPRNQNAVTGFDAQVGKYRNGVQYVKKQELKLTNTRRIK